MKMCVRFSVLRLFYILKNYKRLVDVPKDALKAVITFFLKILNYKT